MFYNSKWAVHSDKNRQKYVTYLILKKINDLQQKEEILKDRPGDQTGRFKTCLDDL